MYLVSGVCVSDPISYLSDVRRLVYFLGSFCVGLLRGDEVEFLGGLLDGPAHAGRCSKRHIQVGGG